jgi:polyhydroxybutyrate depolymerase
MLESLRVRALLCALMVAACSGEKAGTAVQGGSQAPGVGEQMNPSSGTTAGAGAGASGAGGAATGAAGTSAPVAGSTGGSAGTAGADAGATVDAATPGDGGDMPDAATSPRGTGPGDWMAGDYPPNLLEQTYLEIEGVEGQDGNVRQYKVHVPPGYDPNVPTPLVFCFHGLGQNAVMFCVDGSGMVAKSDEAGFIVVMPNGFENSWNAGTCCGGASTAQLDDVALVRAIFEEVGTHVNVDLDRVYATGLSNGGYMSYRLACEASDIFAAVAPGAGAVGTNDSGYGTNLESDFTACAPSEPVSVLHLHGTEDGLVPYAQQKPSLDKFATSNGCALTTAPAAEPISAGDTSCISYADCPSGTQVIGCTVEGGGHVWFGNDTCGTGAPEIGCAIVGANSDTLVNTDAVWDFFSALAK